jgi:hypothetical protein
LNSDIAEDAPKPAIPTNAIPPFRLRIAHKPTILSMNKLFGPAGSRAFSQACRSCRSAHRFFQKPIAFNLGPQEGIPFAAILVLACLPARPASKNVCVYNTEHYTLNITEGENVHDCSDHEGGDGLMNVKKIFTTAIAIAFIGASLVACTKNNSDSGPSSPSSSAPSESASPSPNPSPSESSPPENR